MEDYYSHAIPNGAVAMQHCHMTTELSNRGLPTQEKPVSGCNLLRPLMERGVQTLMTARRIFCISSFSLALATQNTSDKIQPNKSSNANLLGKFGETPVVTSSRRSTTLTYLHAVAV